mmetsp:Transcript_67222/g.161074  ORF Transcript_67222/g.161074 Transcript_67222/m.161074 type:complete len:95 (-) Transcript_67222:22-306(-)
MEHAPCTLLAAMGTILDGANCTFNVQEFPRQKECVHLVWNSAAPHCLRTCFEDYCSRQDIDIHHIDEWEANSHIIYTMAARVQRKKRAALSFRR